MSAYHWSPVNGPQSFTELLTPVAWAYMGMEYRTEMREVAATKVAVCGRLHQFNSLAYAEIHYREVIFSDFSHNTYADVMIR